MNDGMPNVKFLVLFASCHLDQKDEAASFNVSLQPCSPINK
jgi:hypothetical protein